MIKRKSNHTFQLLMFVVAFALIGTAFLIISHALSPNSEVAPSGVALVSQQSPQSPNSNPGQFFTKGATQSSPSAQRTLLKFPIEFASDSITRVTLKIYAQSASSNGFSVKQLVDNNWDPNSVTFRSMPSIGNVVNDSGAVSANSWVNVDVTAYVKSSQNSVSFAVWPKDSNLIAYSNSGSTAPRLFVETSRPQVDTTPPTSVNLAIPSSNQTVKGMVNFDSAGDDDTGVNKVEFYIDGKLIGNAGPNANYGWVIFDQATQSYGYNTAGSATQTKIADGQHTIYSVVYDAAGNHTQSPAVSFTVDNSGGGGGGGGPTPNTIHAMFYYPWFPETWGTSNALPFTNFHPSAGFYSSDTVSVTNKHIQQMTYSGVDAAIASWWGQNTHNENNRIPALLNSADNNSNGKNLKWALYYEKESVGDPSVAEISGDLAYIKTKYANSNNYLKINNKPVIFVFTDGGDSCSMAQRWQQANANQGFYVVLKVFANYPTCQFQPDGWHQYGPASATDSQGQYSYTISPGFWKKGEATARLPRLDSGTWAANIDKMLNSGAKFQLITSFNEWGEGTAVEPATEWASSSGYGTYIDVLHQKLNNVNTPPPVNCNPISTPPTGFTAALTNANSNVVNLKWSAPQAKAGDCAIQQYVLVRNGQLFAAPTGTTFTDSGTNYNTTYTYLLQVQDVKGNLSPATGLASSPSTITTPKLTDTAAPDVPTVSASATSSSTVNISWNTVQDNPKNGQSAGVAGYKVFRNGAQIATTPANANSFGDQFSFVKDTQYSYTVAAFDAANPSNQSAQSAPAQVTPNVSVGTGATNVIVAAGDIATSGGAAGATGNLINSMNPAPVAVLTLGDNAYDAGTPSQFSSLYNPAWGPFKSKTYPSPGNHDYGTSGASGYYNYFNATANSITGHSVSGSPNQGYYAYNIGNSWRFYSLNSEVNQSAANSWMNQDLATNPKACVVGYWHKPPFSSSNTHQSDGFFTRSGYVQTLFSHKGSILLGGHQHQYERFAHMTPSNTVDAATGMREFVAGTGGAGLYQIGAPQPGSEVRNQVEHGVLILTINDNGTYHWEFRATSTYRDSGDDTCTR